MMVEVMMIKVSLMMVEAMMIMVNDDGEYD